MKIASIDTEKLLKKESKIKDKKRAKKAAKYLVKFNKTMKKETVALAKYDEGIDVMTSEEAILRLLNAALVIDPSDEALKEIYNLYIAKAYGKDAIVPAFEESKNADEALSCLMKTGSIDFIKMFRPYYFGKYKKFLLALWAMVWNGESLSEAKFNLVMAYYDELLDVLPCLCCINEEWGELHHVKKEAVEEKKEEETPAEEGKAEQTPEAPTEEAKAEEAKVEEAKAEEAQAPEAK